MRPTLRDFAAPVLRELPVRSFPSRTLCAAAFIVCSAATSTSAQTSLNAPAKAEQRTIRAVNYRRAGTTTKISFRSSDPNQIASGEAEVKNKGSRVEIAAKFMSLEPATRFGLQYLTYVLWAVSPQGRAENLGELTLKNGSGEVKAITDMQTFGMVVTAEPYFAVTQPGTFVVLENVAARKHNRSKRATNCSAPMSTPLPTRKSKMPFSASTRRRLWHSLRRATPSEFRGTPQRIGTRLPR